MKADVKSVGPVEPNKPIELIKPAGPVEPIKRRNPIGKRMWLVKAKLGVRFQNVRVAGRLWSSSEPTLIREELEQPVDLTALLSSTALQSQEVLDPSVEWTPAPPDNS